MNARKKFSPSQIDEVPRTEIFKVAARCASCTFKSKVRHNFVRHLKAHLAGLPALPVSPVNPVLCLQRKERVSDYTVCLASSTHADGKLADAGIAGVIKDTTVDEETVNVPKYVPEKERYFCGAQNCMYISSGMENLIKHIEALHFQEYFVCPHCDIQNAEIIEMFTKEEYVTHLYFHGPELFKCNSCDFHHHTRESIKHHLLDIHPLSWFSILVVRKIQVEDEETMHLTESIPELTIEMEVERIDAMPIRSRNNLCGVRHIRGILIEDTC